MTVLPTAALGEVARQVPCKVIVPFDGIVAGLKQAAPADRATGAQVVLLAGAVSGRSNWDGVVFLVGERTIWAHVSAGEVVSFASFISLGLAGVLGLEVDGGVNDGAEVTLSRPERLAAELAGHDITPGRALGALIGAELAATRPYWLGQEVLLVGQGQGQGSKLYADALARQGAMLQQLDHDETFAAGQAALIAAREAAP